MKPIVNIGIDQFNPMDTEESIIILIDFTSFDNVL